VTTGPAAAAADPASNPGAGGTGEEDAIPQEHAAAAWARAAAQGIHRLAIPTPFPVGRVNAYLVEDDPLTLVDSGPNSARALDELESALAAHGHRVEEVGLLVLTHQHVDHVGLAEVIARRARAEVAALAALGDHLADFKRQGPADDRFAEWVMRTHGVPGEIVLALRAASASVRAWGAPVSVTRPLTDGAELKLRDRTLTAVHRPGHSPSDTLFWDRRSGTALAGDHLLAHVSSNPIVSRPLEDGGEEPNERPRALLSYLRSLEQTRAMDLALVLPGHGDPITDHVALIDSRERLHRRRAERIHRLLASGPLSAHEVARRMWGDAAITQAYLTLSEALGHLDLLVHDGRVREERDGDVVRFRAS
jgi:glyoxylase-like metal-dependent hydrolase (beta-lactamase superfamily II)